jgi:hypothetical protein
MDNAPVKLPVYLKIAQIFMGIAVLFFILYIGQDINIPLYVLIAYLIVQFIDNNLFVPKIVASKVRSNRWFQLLSYWWEMRCGVFRVCFFPYRLRPL